MLIVISNSVQLPHGYFVGSGGAFNVTNSTVIVSSTARYYQELACRDISEQMGTREFESPAAIVFV